MVKFTDNPAHQLARLWTSEASIYRFYAYAAVALVLLLLPHKFEDLVAAVYAYLDSHDMPRLKVSASLIYWIIMGIMAGDTLDTLFKKLKHKLDIIQRRHQEWQRAAQRPS